jgi:hypothetical protein
MSRLEYIEYDEHAKRGQEIFMEAFVELESMILPLHDCREKSIALTKLEEAFMWIGKYIRNDQIRRMGMSTE